MKWIEKRKKKLGYKGCRNCKYQIEPLRTCEWLEKGGDGDLHLICPKWKKKDEVEEMDIKKYCIPKEEYNIPTVNEGIQEGRKLVFCKDCKHKDRVSDYCMYLKREVKREEFCCWGTQK